MRQTKGVGSRAEEGGQNKLAAKQAVYLPAGSPRNPLPHAVVAALTALIDYLPDAPSAQRVELRSIRSRLCRAYRIHDPQAPRDEVAAEWEENDDETIPE